jgi:hypothetical protein
MANPSGPYLSAQGSLSSLTLTGRDNSADDFGVLERHREELKAFKDDLMKYANLVRLPGLQNVDQGYDTATGMSLSS